MRYIFVTAFLLILSACSESGSRSTPINNSNPPSNNITLDMEGLLWSNSIEFDLRLAAALNAFDVGPFIDYDRRFQLTDLPDAILQFIDSLDISDLPNEFSPCGAAHNDQTYVVKIKDSDGNVRVYVDNMNCNIGILSALPEPDDVLGILDQEKLHILRTMLLEFDPQTLNP